MKIKVRAREFQDFHADFLWNITEKISQSLFTLRRNVPFGIFLGLHRFSHIYFTTVASFLSFLFAHIQKIINRTTFPNSLSFAWEEKRSKM